MASRITSLFSWVTPKIMKRSFADFEEERGTEAEDEKHELSLDYQPPARSLEPPRKRVATAPVQTRKLTPSRNQVSEPSSIRKPTATRRPASAPRPAPARRPVAMQTSSFVRKPLTSVSHTSQRINALLHPPKKRRIVSQLLHVEIPVRRRPIKPLANAAGLYPTSTSPSTKATLPIIETDRHLDDAPPAQRLRRKPRLSYVEASAIEITDESSYEDLDEESDSASDFSAEEMAIDDSTDPEEEAASSEEDSGEESEVEIVPRRNQYSNSSRRKRIIQFEDREESAADVTSEHDESVMTSQSELKKKPKKEAKPPALGEVSSRNGIDKSLPPMTDIKEIFKHMTERAMELGFQKCLDHLDGRILNVATMCSGTESPILALTLIKEALKDRGLSELNFKHCFSAEIEPFKQAYIERNFDIDIIFRDIKELTIDGKRADTATTAYGSKVPVPGNIDLLVAGFVCKDRSNLNSRQKEVEDKGQTKDTFEAILSYAAVHRPSIVVLENVVGKKKQWEQYKEWWEEKGFECSYDNKFDTKNYYLPQTRTRGYMICVDREKYAKGIEQEEENVEGVEDAVAKWKVTAKDFKRKASSPYTDFVLPFDDRRVQQVRTEFLRRNAMQQGKKARWEKCRGRHELERRFYNLGEKRPFSEWVNGGSCVSPDYVEGPWLKRQVERVWDCLDIHLLRNAHPKRKSFDSQYKMRIWDLSQNCDRFRDTQPFGIAPCLTPTGIPFMTDRGAPATGYDFLLLQGIPIDKISFTTETSDQLQDLAGNAMSSTVVSAAMLSALIVAFKSLHPTSAAAINQDTPKATPQYPTQGHNLLKETFPDEHSYSSLDLRRVITDGSTSRSMCNCEGRGPSMSSQIRECQSCNHTACTSCAGKPSHNYGSTNIRSGERMNPQDFQRRWELAFPDRIKLQRTPRMDSFREFWTEIDNALCEQYMNILMKAFNTELLLQPFTRSRTWTVRYESPSVRLELALNDSPEWRLYGKPRASTTKSDRKTASKTKNGKTTSKSHVDETNAIRYHLVARSRLRLDGNILDCSWEPFNPYEKEFPISAERVGETHPSWCASLGLPEHKDEEVSTSIKVTSPNTGLSDIEFSGTYNLRPSCGTAQGYLYRREVPLTGSETRNDVYLFLDPSPLGNPEYDCFVFSKDHGRLAWGESREVIARLHHEWRPLVDNKLKNPIVAVSGEWGSKFAVAAKIIPVSTHLRVLSPSSAKSWADVTVSKGCSIASTILKCQFDAPSFIRSQWAGLRIVNLGDKAFFDSFSFILRRIQNLPSLQEWTELAMPSDEECAQCAPRMPTILWRLDEKSKKKSGVLQPFENHMDAGVFEKKLKNRPPLFVIELAVEDRGTITISHNLQSMVHRACAKLSNVWGPPKVSWRLLTDAHTSSIQAFPRFTLRDNSEEDPFKTPEGMLHRLFPSQERSLAWMRRQEAASADPFTLCEVEEALLNLNWRAEVKVEKDVQLKGGVLASGVGFGKTIMIIALSHSEFKEKSCQKIIQENSLSEGTAPGIINIPATLIIAANNITKQWKEQIIEFLGTKLEKEIILIQNVSRLKTLTIEDFMKAKYIIVSWHVLSDPSYISRLSQMAGMPEPLTTKGRAFSSWIDKAMPRISFNLKTLKEDGADALEESLRYQFEETTANTEFHKEVASEGLGETQHGNKVAKNTQPPSSKKKRPPQGKAWTSLTFPLLQMLRPNRIVIDEYPYLEGGQGAKSNNNVGAHISITKLKSEKMWVMSGTPLLDDFADVKRLAAFFKINLGSDTEAPGITTRRNLKRLADERTKTEEFMSFRESRSQEWHERRHAYAQSFLDQYARQDKPDFDHIACKEHLSVSHLHFQHRVLYSELLHHFASNEMKMKKLNEAVYSDRTKHINSSIAASESPEEALLNFSSAIRHSGNIASIRETEYSDVYRKLELKIMEAEELTRLRGTANNKYVEWKAGHGKSLGDPESSEIVKGFVEKGKALADIKANNSSSKKNTDTEAGLRVLTAEIRNLEREYVTIARSYRYLKALTQLYDRTNKLIANCDDCEAAIHDRSDLFVIPKCGHYSCGECLRTKTNPDVCIAHGCDANIEDCHAIGLDTYRGMGILTNTPTSAKLEEMFNVITTIKNDQALVFVPSYQLLSQIDKELTTRGIQHLAIKENNSNPGKAISDFQKDTTYRVLVLNVYDENASGVNLQNANHVMFLSPLLATSQHDYESQMEQAVGRARRYGQKKTVHLYHFVALDTIDVDVMQRHHRRSTLLTGTTDAPGAHDKKTSDENEPSRFATNKLRETILVPQSWVLDRKKARGAGINTDETEHFSTLVRFSEMYEEEVEVEEGWVEED